MAVASIYLFSDGKCNAVEFIEDDCLSFNNDGTVHYVCFIEGNQSIQLSPASFSAAELLERIPYYLVDELDAYLLDESGNYLIAII